MYPLLLEIGPLKLYSFGLMMAVAFLTANYFVTQEVKRRHDNKTSKLDESMVWNLTWRALVGGVGGSKLFSILENWSDFTRDPMGQLFSPAGLTFYGGFIVAALLIFFYINGKKLRFREVADIVAPTVLLAYGIGRIGCQLAGDGDYGIPSRLPWAMAYPMGAAKPSSVLPEYFIQNPEARAEWHYDSLRAMEVGTDRLGQTITRLDEVVTVHPAPVYEALFCVIAFMWLWSLRKKWQFEYGKLFSLTLVLMGFERLLVEFIRLNPLYAGLSMAQWISIVMMIAGSYALATKYRGPAGTPQPHVI